MKTHILNLGKALNKAEQKTVNGGRRGLSCVEWCGFGAQNPYPKPLFCNCNSGNTGGNNNGGGTNNGPVDPV